MNWNEASGVYRNKLAKMLNVYKHTVNLSDLPETRVPTEWIDSASKHLIPAKRQLERLEKGQFHIAVVGLEKSGKSTFLNAWLEYDLLPSDSLRCTFSTTRISSVSSINEQELVVQPKTFNEFSLYKSQLEIVAGGTGDASDRAKNDLVQIEKNSKTLYEVVKNGRINIPFARLEDIENHLKTYIANERYAHAVREVDIRTPCLAASEGIIFFDLPGLNSGLAKHIEESQQMLCDCDAVILIQSVLKPSLESNEQKLIQFIQEGDEIVGISGKLFVFLSYVDRVETPELLDHNLQAAAEDWYRRGNLPQNRIVPGSAAAFLAIRGLAGSHINRFIVQNPDEIRAKLGRLHRIANPDENLLLKASGIPMMKEKIFQYFENERVEILKQRCDGPIQQILEIGHRIFEHVRKNYPEDPEQAKRIEESQRRMMFTKWWTDEAWGPIKAEINRYFSTRVPSWEIIDENRSGIAEILAVKTLRFRYVKLVQDGLRNLKSRSNKRRQIIFDEYAQPVFDAYQANLKWRICLYAEISDLLVAIAKELALELINEANNLINKMTDALWGSLEVRQFLVDPQELFQANLQRGLEVLFLRFARPLAMVLIRTPSGSEPRSKIIQRLGADIELVDNYYAGSERALNRLKRFANHGSQLLFDDNMREQILGAGVQSITEIIRKKDDPLSSFYLKLGALKDQIKSIDLNEKQKSIYEEVEVDLIVLEEYLVEAIFEATGFGEFCEQELTRLLHRFEHDLAGVWPGAAMNEYLAGNSRLLSCLPAELQRQEHAAEVSDRLRQLSIALQAN